MAGSYLDSKKRSAPSELNPEEALKAGPSPSSAPLDLTAFPTSVFLVSICSFLPLEDIFTLRLVNGRIKHLLNGGDGQDDLWKMVLQRDFGFSADDVKEENGPIWTLNDHSETSLCPPSPNMLTAATSLFDAVKKWRRSSAWYYGDPSLKQPSFINLAARVAAAGREIPPHAKALSQLRQPHLCAPVFLRAARIWQSLFQWLREGSKNCVEGSSLTKSQEEYAREIIEEFFELKGDRCDKNCIILAPGAAAILSLRAFCLGQDLYGNIAFGMQEGVYGGIMGGYEAYSYYRSNFLTLKDCREGFQVSTNLAGDDDPDGLGSVLLNGTTGALCLKEVDDCEPVKLHHRENKEYDLFLWLEEYTRRLTEGEIGVGVMGFRPSHPVGITLFPRYVPGSLPRTINDVPLVSRKVTRGIEIITSAVFVPHREDELGFIYSVRIRLLTPDDGDEYVPLNERGFETCQLQRRHWEITNYETDMTQIVDGEGVIGMKPIFNEGGYVDDGQTFQGTFQYQSCTGGMKQGKFGGFLTFHAISGDESDLQFDAEVGCFALDGEPDFLF